MTTDVERHGQHTPGPWIVFSGEGFRDVCPAGRAGHIAADIRTDADARLIATAPDMLAIVTRITEIVPELARLKRCPIILRALCVDARAAISKALGDDAVASRQGREQS